MGRAERTGSSMVYQQEVETLWMVGQDDGEGFKAGMEMDGAGRIA